MAERQAAQGPSPPPAAPGGGAQLPPVQEGLPVAGTTWHESAHAFIHNLQAALAELARGHPQPPPPPPHPLASPDSDPNSASVSVQIPSQTIPNPADAPSASISIAASGSSAIRGFFGAAAAWNRPRHSSASRRGTGRVSRSPGARRPRLRDPPRPRVRTRLAEAQSFARSSVSSVGANPQAATLCAADNDTVSISVSRTTERSAHPQMSMDGDEASFAFDGPSTAKPLLDALPRGESASQSWTAIWRWRKQPGSRGDSAVSKSSRIHERQTSAASLGMPPGRTDGKGVHHRQPSSDICDDTGVQCRQASAACCGPSIGSGSRGIPIPGVPSDPGSWRSQLRTDGFAALDEPAAAVVEARQRFGSMPSAAPDVVRFPAVALHVLHV
jgi:hypothetical protein